VATRCLRYGVEWLLVVQWWLFKSACRTFIRGMPVKDRLEMKAPRGFQVTTPFRPTSVDDIGLTEAQLHAIDIVIRVAALPCSRSERAKVAQRCRDRLFAHFGCEMQQISRSRFREVLALLSGEIATQRRIREKIL